LSGRGAASFAQPTVTRKRLRPVGGPDGGSARARHRTWARDSPLRQLADDGRTDGYRNRDRRPGSL